MPHHFFMDIEETVCIYWDSCSEPKKENRCLYNQSSCIIYEKKKMLDRFAYNTKGSENYNHQNTIRNA